MSSTHRWRFFNAGGFDQVKLESAEDLMNLATLDQKLWVALACPTSGLEFDSRTLALIDTDQDGRVRPPEVLAAVKFACAHLKDPSALLMGPPTLPLAAIRDDNPESKILAAAARRILDKSGRSDATELAIADFADPATIFAETAFNGDGIITELSAANEDERAAIRDMLSCFGGERDRSGGAGVRQEVIDAFFAEIDLYASWYAQAEAGAAPGAPAILPLGAEGTTAAAAAIRALRGKVDDYFGRCRLAAFDPRTVSLLNRQEEEYLTLACEDLTISVEEIAGFPLAQVAAGRPLPLTGPVNPAHGAAVEVLRKSAVVPLLGERAELAEADWLRLLEIVAAYEAWMAAMPALKIAALGATRLGALREAASLKARLDALMVQDKALEAEAMSLENVERLVRYRRDLAMFCMNFVSFKDFYDGKEPAIFQSGTLYLDQRSCGLCLPVDDPAKHATLAGLAGVYLAYLDCVRKATGEKRQIVAGFTAGDSDNLMVGRNGVFYDRKGGDWDATIVKIIDNPISLRQAFWSPYKKFVRFVEEQFAKRAAAADAESHTMLSAAAAAAANVDKGAKPPERKKLDVGTVAALGVAVGAVGAFATGIIGYATGLLSMGILPTLGAVLGIILLISLPSVLLAYLKLRKRNLGPILDANGWAVNSKAKINVPFGRTLTGLAKLPPGARRDPNDPFADKGWPWKSAVFVLLLLYALFRWYGGALDSRLPAPLRARTVLGDWFERPATAPVSPAASGTASGPTKKP